jgi:hypothetical protein
MKYLTVFSPPDANLRPIAGRLAHPLELLFHSIELPALAMHRENSPAAISITLFGA